MVPLVYVRGPVLVKVIVEALSVSVPPLMLMAAVVIA
jgi:hypothetical protein